MHWNSDLVARLELDAGHVVEGGDDGGGVVEEQVGLLARPEVNFINILKCSFYVHKCFSTQLLFHSKVYQYTQLEVIPNCYAIYAAAH